LRAPLDLLVKNQNSPQSEPPRSLQVRKSRNCGENLARSPQVHASGAGNALL
jgi:hypothetical protein